MCVIFNITEEGHITLDIQKCMWEDVSHFMQ
jgi:hypothetical protein